MRLRGSRTVHFVVKRLREIFFIISLGRKLKKKLLAQQRVRDSLYVKVEPAVKVWFNKINIVPERATVKQCHTT